MFVSLNRRLHLQVRKMGWATNLGCPLDFVSSLTAKSNGLRFLGKVPAFSSETKVNTTLDDLIITDVAAKVNAIMECSTKSLWKGGNKVGVCLWAFVETQGACQGGSKGVAASYHCRRWRMLRFSIFLHVGRKTSKRKRCVSGLQLAI